MLPNLIILITLCLTPPTEAKHSDVNEIKLEILKRLQCSLGLVFDQCAVNGAWTQWSLWGSCMGQCGQVGLRWRTRECSNPIPSNNGATCLGNDHESKECRLKGCTLEEYTNLVKCDVIKSKELEILEIINRKYPSLTTKCLESDCHYKAVDILLKNRTDRYWNALHCVKHNVGCPEYGGWSNWKEWSDCSSHCGSGTQLRCRTCDNPRPTGRKYKCQGDNCTTMPCLGTKCNANSRGKWDAWGEWSECNASCGQGIRKRARKCNSTLEKPTNNTNTKSYKIRKRTSDNHLNLITGQTCMGPFEELSPCYKRKCPVDGGWSDWEPWSQCSVGCGLGTQSRSRACSSPRRTRHGRPCIGPITHIRHCFQAPCQMVPHVVAVFLGDGTLNYYRTRTPNRLLHLFIKFRSSEDSGDLIKRESTENKKSYCVRLFLEAGYIVLSVTVSKCYLTLITQHKIQNP